MDGALSALRSLVKERLSGGSSGSGYNKQVCIFFIILNDIWDYHKWKCLSNPCSPCSSRAPAAARRMSSNLPTTTSTRWCWRVARCGWWSSSHPGVDTAKSESSSWQNRVKVAFQIIWWRREHFTKLSFQDISSNRWPSSVISLEPEWAAAATAVKEQTKGKVRLGAVDATVHQGVSSRYGVSKKKKKESWFNTDST